MKDAARLFLYAVAVLLLGALLAPPVFWAAQFFIARGELRSLATFGFDSYFHRTLLLAALGLFWPLLRSLKIRRWRDLGLEKNRRPAKDLAAGFFIAAIPLLCCGALLIMLQVYSLRQNFLWQKFPAVLGASIAVPILEELLFRGFLLGVLVRSFPRTAAVLSVSALFAVLHLLKTPELSPPNESVRWFSGFVSLGDSFSQFQNLPHLVGNFLTLFAIACILADARLTTRSLWLPIGLHAGWIFANGLFSKAAHREMLALPWIGKDLLDGIVPLTLAFISWVLMRGWLKYAEARRTSSASRTR